MPGEGQLAGAHHLGRGARSFDHEEELTGVGIDSVEGLPVSVIDSSGLA